MTITTHSLPDQPETVATPAPQHQTHSWPRLAQAAAELGVPLNATALTRLATYRDLLTARNAQVNLTAIREPEAMERRLFLDAIAMVPWLDAVVRASGRVHPRLIDVGSGAGFPGLVLKIVRPDLEVVLLDATGKKVRFLAEVAAATGLSDIETVHGRAEDIARERAYRERFDLATARAVASLPVLLELTTPFLDVGGTALLPKGLDLAGELKPGARAARLLGCRIVSSEVLPTGDTRLVIVEKTTLTPKAYPRRTGLPNQAPLGVSP